MSARAPALRAPSGRATSVRAAPVERPPRHLRVVDPAARVREGRLRRAVSLFAVVSVVSVFVTVAFHVALAQGQVDLTRLDKQTAQEQQRYEELRLQVAQLAAPAHVVSRAKQLGMLQAAPKRWVSAPLPKESPSPNAAAAGAGTTAPSPEWGKVKPHLVAQP